VIDSYNRKPNYLIQILLEIQGKHHWLPRPALYWIAKRLEVPMGQIIHIATFYKVFSLEPKGKYICRVCLGTACAVRGSQEILDQAERLLKIKAGSTTDDGKYTLEAVNCLGCCALGPVMMVNDDYVGKLDTSKLKPTFAKYK
jgi:NADH-quinone oxidoreductase subunit E